MSKKKIIIFVAIAVVIVAGFLIWNFVINENTVISSKNEKYRYCIDSLKLKQETGELVIVGWCYKWDKNVAQPGTKDSLPFKAYLVKNIKDIKTQEDFDKNAIVLETQRALRNDVQEVFGTREGIDIKWAGFEASGIYDINTTDKYYLVLDYGEDSSRPFDTELCITDIINEELQGR